ncbi:MAG: glycerophosphodiester phosphodiesterase family protein, partial [Bacillota bacterium]
MNNINKYIILIVLLLIILIVVYGLYSFIKPSKLGEEILKSYGFNYPAIIAHRGASNEAPESTVPAFTKAIKNGVDYIEVDIQRTADGEIIVFHDRDLKRLSNVKEVFPDKANLEISEFTLEELKRLDYGSWFNRTYPEAASIDYEGLNILTLEEVIELLKEKSKKTGLCIEFKNPKKYPGIEEQVVQIVEKSEWLEKNLQTNIPNVLMISFSEKSLKKIRDINSKLPRILLLNENMMGTRDWKKWTDKAEEYADGMAVKGFISWPWHISSAHQKGLFVYSYVINESWQIKILSRFKADGYITDRPELLTSFFNRLEE